MPKAKPFSESDEDEKTTIESQWEEEASTTIEQGELADKLAAIVPEVPRRPVTGITSTSASALEEPTVDDRHVNPALAFPLPSAGVARLAITQGNDLGREVEIYPGKTYTVGRGLDNDVVLTDIAVSRKHFDLRFEDGGWVVVDRGSGNGTIVNGNIEDNPFGLANGDVIEIGNTTFRFDHEGGPERRPANLGDLDEEPSTVAGKPPLRSELVPVVEAPLELPPEPRPAPRERPRTLPPPAPLRARSPSAMPAQPVLPAPARRDPTRPPTASVQPAMPMMQPPAMQPPPELQPLAYRQTSVADVPQPLAYAGSGPVAAPRAPAMLVEPSRQPSNLGLTIPGQGMTTSRPHYNGYPQATEIPPNSIHAQLLVMSQQGGRQDHSTAHVPPLSYGAPPLAPLRTSSGISLRTKLLLGAAGVAVLAAIVTIAVAGGSKSAAAPAAKSGSAPPKQIVAPAASHTNGSSPALVTALSHATPDTHVTPDTQATPAPHATPDTHATPAPHATPDTHVAVETHHGQPVTHPDDATPHATPHTRPVHHTAPPPHHVAAIDTGDAERRATDLYGDQKFDDAASTLEAAARTTDERDARRLRHTAQLYALVGRALAAPSSPANQAYERLQAAVNYDHVVGGALSDDIRSKLGAIAPKAALTYFAVHQYDKAHAAVHTAESLGTVDATAKLVKQQLEAKAGELYGIASKELGSQPDDAKSKLQLIENMVDASSPWYEKADRLLKGNG